MTLGDHAETALLLTAWLGSGLFLARYTARVPKWWRTDIGWYLVAVQFVLFALASIGAARRIFGDDFPGRAAATFGVFVLWDVAVWWLNWIAHRENQWQRARSLPPSDYRRSKA